MHIVRKKTLPEYFRAVRAREKNFEIRKDEDDIQVGTLLILVKYVLRDVPRYGLMPGYCIIGW